MSIRYNDDFKKEVVKVYMARDKSTVQIAADYKNHIGNRHGGPISVPVPMAPCHFTLPCSYTACNDAFSITFLNSSTVILAFSAARSSFKSPS